MDTNNQPEIVKPRAPTKAYKDMTPSEKVAFVFKLVVCILSFGFIFPNAGD